MELISAFSSENSILTYVSITRARIVMNVLTCSILLLFMVCCAGAHAASAAFMSGIDVLEQADFDVLKGKRVGVITNQTGVDRQGSSTVDVLFASRKLSLVAIFSPEHGFRGDQTGGALVGNATDTATGLPVYSLYGKTRRPTDEMLNGIDALVFDIQDVGARFYTYLSTMGLCMEEAAKRGIEFVVLDRSNPLGGEILEGPVLEDAHEFTGYFPVPIRHGLTPGEMARLHMDLKKLKLKLTVVPLKGWTRCMLYDETGYPWVKPSPNIRNLDAALLYPGLGLFESSNMSVGRGTESPFLWFGAPWLETTSLLQVLESAAIPGLRFTAEIRTPTDDIYSGKVCQGVRIEVLDRHHVRSLDVFVRVVCALRDQKTAAFLLKGQEAALMVGNNIYKAVFDSKDSPEKILADFESSWRKFDSNRRKFLLY
ncbi:MAG: DUF1343 domain-containing protein [Candidatus Riflebacteria bacterium]|nr:DUF1343 domain-containing protein [Candidatus Riflebacteria bacterium]